MAKRVLVISIPLASNDYPSPAIEAAAEQGADTDALLESLAEAGVPVSEDGELRYAVELED